MSPYWRIVAFYIFTFASGGVIRPFINVYMKDVGLTGTEIGLLQSWTAFGSIALTPIIGVLADRTQRHRATLGVVAAIKGLVAALIPVSNAWLWLLATVGTRNITSQAQDALMNRLTLAYLNGSNRLGRIRFWGSLAFGSTSILAGLVAQDSTIAIFLFAGFIGVAAAPFVSGFPAQIAPRTRVKLGRRSPELLFLFGVIFIHYLGRSGIETFAFVYVADGLGGEYRLIGLLGAVMGLSPLPALLLADNFIERRGPMVTMMGAFALMVVASFGYAMIDTPLAAVPLAAATGFANSVILVSLVIMLGQLGDPQRAATDQMLAQLTVPGIAMLLAQPVNGWMYDTLGGPALFLLDGGLALAAILALVYHSEIRGNTP